MSKTKVPVWNYQSLKCHSFMTKCIQIMHDILTLIIELHNEQRAHEEILEAASSQHSGSEGLQ